MWTLQKKGEAQLSLSGIRKEQEWPQQSYTKDSSIVSVAVVLNWRSISVCQGSSEGPSPSRSVSGAPFQTLHSDRFPYSALTAPCAALWIPTTNLHSAGHHWRAQIRAFHTWSIQCNCSSLVSHCTNLGHWLATNQLPSKLLESRGTFCSDRVSAPARHWIAMTAQTAAFGISMPVNSFGKPQPTILTLQISSNKILPYNLKESPKLLL